MSMRACGSVYGPLVSYTYTGGLASAPNAAGVSVSEISRIGTRRSGREPSKCTLRERGSGWTAASSTWAEDAMNLGWAFMDAPSRVARSAEGSSADAPYAGMTRIRFQGCFSPPARTPAFDTNYIPAPVRKCLTGVAFRRPLRAALGPAPRGARGGREGGRAPG